MTTYDGGVALHLSRKKVHLLRYKEINSERKRFSFVNTFKLDAISLTMETGAEYLQATALIQTTVRTYFFIKGGEKEKIENNVWLTDGDVLRISLSSRIFFNFYILICNFIKFLKEKAKQLWQKKMKNSTI